ncbi:hypothetical protein SAMN04488510_10465 [Fervidobacterium changbaicum]|uniref:Four helix bundle sensory module for signal transduction n=1 Tax=Fervidobacterium changbaicum TaxID=310769 RepID=A0ABX5QS68_9BACT|nr:hypothetical protein [Fervidobacterium changbaicum]QAV33294.1 hypothetical protein CBS1_05875 [Fervidobacterium changbaicum]SDH07715.1 hypothetical protein SAMN04488510_10465 [Fervidobacterium changbaicum]
MILIPRKVAVTISILTLILSLAGSFLYFSNKTYSYISKLEQKFSEIRNVYRTVSQLEEQGKQLEKVRSLIYNIQGTFADDEMTSAELKAKLEELLSEKVLAIDYLVIKSSFNEPLAFKKTAVKYTLIIRSSE